VSTSPLDLMLFSRQMHTLLKAGVPIMRALASLQESTANKSFAAVVGDIRESLDAGRHRRPGRYAGRSDRPLGREAASPQTEL
jgi:type II secretory pathway component PulF